MLIKSLSLENFRSFKDRTQFDLNKINAFVGPNKAGKSNIVKCLEFLNSVSRNDWNDLYIDNVFDYNTTKRIIIEIEFYLNNDDRLRLVKKFFPNCVLIDFEKNPIFEQIKYLISFGNNEIYQEKVSILDTKGEYKDLIIHEFEGAIPNQYVSNLGKLSGIEEINKFDSVNLEKKIGKWQKTRSMFHVDDHDRTIEYEIGNLIIEFFESIKIYSSVNIQNTIDFESRIKRKIDKEVKEYVDFLGLLTDIIDFSNIQINRDKPGIVTFEGQDNSSFKYDSLEFMEKDLSAALKFSSLSYGSQQLLHMLFLIEEAKDEVVICIEEPENSLHSHIQKKLFERITHKVNSGNLQFFITTHSPVFTALAKDISTTYLITRTKGVSKATLIDNDSQLKLIKQHLGIDNSDIYLSPYVIFVEGDSEERAIPIVAKAMGYNQLGKEIRIINFKGKDKIQRLTEFLNYMHYFDTKAIVLADGHKNIKDRMKDLQRGKLMNFYDKTREEGKEFEDLFDSKMIIDAMKKSQKSFKFEMKEEELETKRKEGNKVANVLEEYYER